MKRLFSFLFGGSAAVTDGPDLVGFVDFVVKALVDAPDEVRVRSESDDDCLKINISCRKSDIGRIIGRRGKTIESIRALVRGAASRQKRKVSVEVAE